MVYTVKEMETIQIGEIEELYERYCEWCHGHGLFPNGLSVEFFDWMNGAA